MQPIYLQAVAAAAALPQGRQGQRPAQVQALLRVDQDQGILDLVLDF